MEISVTGLELDTQGREFVVDGIGETAWCGNIEPSPTIYAKVTAVLVIRAGTVTHQYVTPLVLTEAHALGLIRVLVKLDIQAQLVRQ